MTTRLQLPIIHLREPEFRQDESERIKDKIDVVERLKDRRRTREYPLEQLIVLALGCVFDLLFRERLNL